MLCSTIEVHSQVATYEKATVVDHGHVVADTLTFLLLADTIAIVGQEDLVPKRF